MIEKTEKEGLPNGITHILENGLKVIVIEDKDYKEYLKREKKELQDAEDKVILKWVKGILITVCIFLVTVLYLVHDM